MRIKTDSTSISSSLFPGLPAIFRVLYIPMPLMRSILRIGIAGMSAIFLAGCPDDEECTTCPPPPPPPVIDTTSHNFVWETFTLGDGNSSELYDVAIINDTLAYAVGVIYVKDSSGQYQFPPYSIAIWDGKAWNFKMLYYNGTTALFPIRGITVLGSNNIWLAAGGIFHWDGSSNQTELRFSRFNLPDPNALIEKVWGTSNGNILYGVGTVGTLVYYNGASWQRIDLGTTANIFDVWGILQGGEFTAYVPVSDLTDSNGIKKIFRIKNSVIDSLSWNTGKNVISIWTQDASSFYAVGDGVFRSKDIGWEGMSVGNDVRFFVTRANANNDVFVQGIQFPNAGGLPIVGHYNGSTWKVYEELRKAGAYYFGANVKGNIAIVVGFLGSRAGAVVGKRSN